jgi:hypothetical protein
MLTQARDSMVLVLTIIALFRKDPTQDGVAARVRRVREDGRLVEIPALKCDPERKHCGYMGNVPYRHAPRNSFQAFCREIPTRNLQHITRILVPKKIER